MSFFVTLFSLWIAAHLYICGEPDHERIPPEQVVARYSHAKAAHPGQLISISLVGCSQAARYRQSFDQLLVTDYPFYTDIGTRQALAEWDQTVKDCVATMKLLGKPPPIMIGQGFGHMRDGQWMWRCPTRFERARMVRDAKHEGAAGLVWWHPTERSFWCRAPAG